MAEPTLYPEGREHLSVILSRPIKEALRGMARERRLTLSQLCSNILADYVGEHAEPEAVGAV